MFKPLIQKLKEIGGTTEETMIRVNHPMIKFVRIVTHVLEGDNKSIHEAAGFVESFSANFPCNKCHGSKDEIRIMTNLDLSLARTEANYLADLQRNSVSETG